MLRRLFVQAFRNLSTGVLNFESSRGAYIVGDNNQGKTSVLESIYYLANFKSFLRKTTRETVITHRAKSSVIGGEFQNDSHLYQRYIKLEPRKQWVFQNQDLLTTHAEAHTQLGVDYISADTIRLLYDSPSFRRHQLDVCVQKLDPGMRLVYRHYDRVIQQKLESARYGREWPDVYHQKWQELGTQITNKRQTVLAQLDSRLQPLVGRFIQLSGSKTRIQYRPTVPDLYTQSSPTDAYRVGPHMDDWGIYSNDQLVSQYYSRGINRILALLMVSLCIQYTKPDGQTHMVLLDDPFIELDSANKSAIMRYLWDEFYCIYTTTEHADSKAQLPDLDQLYIQDGCIHRHL
ncbi:hypothetical protein CL648_04315 [bacterium]|nr:hypothetical protein [bacterium]